MASALEQLRDQTGAEVGELLRARERTAERIARRRELLSALEVDDDATVVLMGSWGRRELTPRSDDDYMVLVRGPKGSAPPRPIPEAVGRAFAADPSGSARPGREGIFAQVVYSADLVERVGLDDDSNTNLTRRMLLMLESVAACNADVLEGTRRDVIDDYLSDSVKDFRPPRFLLNDLVRYWRTIGVDFVAKDRRRAGEGWGLRNAKLRTSRKLLFASGLLPVLRCHELAAGQIPDFLAAQLALPPTDRVADAFLRYEDLIGGAAVFSAYDRFLRMIGDEQVRAELAAIDGRAAADRSTAFAEATQLGKVIDRGLIKLLFGDGLRRVTEDYAVF